MEHILKRSYSFNSCKKCNTILSDWAEFKFHLYMIYAEYQKALLKI